ncbi:MAG: extracellular solute-binding protein [Lachnospiraceae bacterium]|nr:extracellular solute-binding protein [Lachnospiraceae bacterium]
MKKRIIIPLAVIMAHFLVITGIIAGGFTRDESVSLDKDAQASDRFTGILERDITLRVLENDTALRQGYFEELLNAFNAEYEQYGIRAVDANMDQYLDLENDGPFGFGPDVLYQANDRIMRYALGRHVQPLPIEQLDCYPHIEQKAWDAYKMTVSGQDYYLAAPVNIQGPFLFYRKSLLPSPDIIESWNALYKFSQERREEGKFGYMKSLIDVYYSIGFLFSYGGYMYGDNNTNMEDIGLARNGAERGAGVLRQLASVMDERCIDFTITQISYSQFANGNFFATMTTPDVYTLFVDELMAVGFTREEAVAEIGIADVPKLPKSGDLSEENPELMPSRMMGGVNGYAISSYTKYPNAALAFVNFATSYDMVMLRNEILGIIPARKDAAENLGELAQTINNHLVEGNIVVMPSLMGQVWTPAETFFTDLANDPFRRDGDRKFTTLESKRLALERLSGQIYDAIHTLK